MAKKYIKSLLCLLLITAVSIAASFVLAANSEKIDEKNPDLILEKIDSACMQYNSIPVYKQASSLEQAGGKYTLSSNSFVAWYDADSVAFGYRHYKIGRSDSLDIQVTLDKESVSTNGGNLYANASNGLMLRSGRNADAQMIYLHVRGGNRLDIVLRESNGAGKCKEDNPSITVTFPLTLKFSVSNGIARAYYQDAKQSKPKQVQFPYQLDLSNGLYAGIAAHSCDPNVPVKGVYSDFTAKGESSGSSASEVESTPSSVSEIVDSDIALPDGGNVILSETFTDGDLTKSANTTEPVWTDMAKNKSVSIKNVENNRMLYSEYAQAADLIGKDAWCDYSVRMDVNFTDMCNPNPEIAANDVALFVRTQANPFYGYTGYSVVLENGHFVNLYKRMNSANKRGSYGTKLVSYDLRTVNGNDYLYLGDGIFHNIQVDCFDNRITVKFDDMQVIDYYDESTDYICSVGNVGLEFYQVYAYVDNIVVRKLEDEFGGEYDNKIGGNWNDPIPNYVAEHESK